jgi:acyl-CoA thioester hydrolase
MSQAPGRVVTPLEGVPFAGWDAKKPIEAPLALHACTVKPEWTDYNGHMTESAYLLVFGDSSDAFFRFIGIDEAYRASGFSLYTIDTRIRNLAELGVGDPLRLTLRLVDLDAKRLHIFHRMTHGGTGAEVAVAEQVLAHVDMRARRSAPFPPELYHRLAAIRAAHSGLTPHPMIGAPFGLASSRRGAR